MLRRTTVAVAAAALVSAVFAPVSGAYANEVPTGKTPQASNAALVSAEKASIQRRVAAAAAVAVEVAASYTVVPGDTLSGIAGRHSTTWQNLYGLNTTIIKDPNLIYPQQVLTVTGTSSRQAPAAQPAAPAPAAASSGWVNPVCASSIGDGLGAGRNHMGVDLPAAHGAPIRAAAAGTVSVATQIYTDQYGKPGGAGNYSIINHGNGVWTIYMHQSSWQVTSGWVNAGQVIGYVGSTGGSSGPHLHFEVRTGSTWGYAQDPISWMNNHGVRLGC